MSTGVPDPGDPAQGKPGTVDNHDHGESTEAVFNPGLLQRPERSVTIVDVQWHLHGVDREDEASENVGPQTEAVILPPDTDGLLAKSSIGEIPTTSLYISIPSLRQRHTETIRGLTFCLLSGQTLLQLAGARNFTPSWANQYFREIKRTVRAPESPHLSGELAFCRDVFDGGDAPEAQAPKPLVPAAARRRGRGRGLDIILRTSSSTPWTWAL